MGDEERAFDGDTMTLEQLREALRERALPVSGNKAQLLSRLQEAVATEAEEGLVPVIRFAGLADNQIWSHGRHSFEPGYQESVDPDRLTEWQQDALDAEVAQIVRIPQEG